MYFLHKPIDMWYRLHMFQVLRIFPENKIFDSADRVLWSLQYTVSVHAVIANSVLRRFTYIVGIADSPVIFIIADYCFIFVICAYMFMATLLKMQSTVLGRGPEGSTMHPPTPHPHPTSLQNYVFLNPQSVHNKKWDVNRKNIGTHYWFTALF